MALKLAKWSDATDGDSISRAIALKLPVGDADCHVDEWKFD
jgi:hypothetical protein